jgi:hypothetical protein
MVSLPVVIWLFCHRLPNLPLREIVHQAPLSFGNDPVVMLCRVSHHDDPPVVQKRSGVEVFQTRRQDEGSDRKRIKLVSIYFNWNDWNSYDLLHRVFGMF